MLSFDDALARLLKQAQPQQAWETLPLLAADQRLLACDLAATMDVPGFDNSAMDGYALHIADFTQLPKYFAITQRIAAGECGIALAANQAARIFTGAPIPAGCNAVIPQEQTSIMNGELLLQAPVKLGQHIRQRGEDIACASTVLSAGTRLGPPQLALAASLGVAQLQVFKRLRVALLCTGDELCEPGQPLKPGGIYNSNRYAIASLLTRLGCEVLDCGQIADDYEATRSALADAAARADVLISCGGVSVGEEDHVKAALQSLGSLDLWQIAMKPGKPLAFGQIAHPAGVCDFIGLPGNPVSAFITFILLARPFLLRKMGRASQYTPTPRMVKAAFAKGPDSRREFLRVKIALNAQGETYASLYPSQGSGVMSSLCWADGLLDVAAQTPVKMGDLLPYLALSELV